MPRPSKPTLNPPALRSNPAAFSANAEGNVTDFPVVVDFNDQTMDYNEEVMDEVEGLRDQALAAALGGDLPSPVGKEGELLRINASAVPSFTSFTGDSQTKNFAGNTTPFLVTGIPNWVKRIDAFFENAWINTGDTTLQFQLGTSAGLYTSNYFSQTMIVATSASTVVKHFPAAGYRLALQNTLPFFGKATFERSTANTWFYNFDGFAENGGRNYRGFGTAYLPGALDRISIHGASGDALTNGSCVVRWS